jgi:hypothetical protein
MPPKQNAKAVAARDRKEAVATDKSAKEKKGKEDADWADDGQDKASKKKKEEDAKKQMEEAKRLAKKTALAEDEANLAKSKAAKPDAKVAISCVFTRITRVA